MGWKAANRTTAESQPWGDAALSHLSVASQADDGLLPGVRISSSLALMDAEPSHHYARHPSAQEPSHMLLPRLAGPDLLRVGLNNNHTGVGGSPDSKQNVTTGRYELGEAPMPPLLHSVCWRGAPTPLAARTARAEAGSAPLTGDTTCRNSLGSTTRTVLPGKTKANSSSWHAVQVSASNLHSPIRFPSPICTAKGREEMPDAAGQAEQIPCVCLKH